MINHELLDPVLGPVLSLYADQQPTDEPWLYRFIALAVPPDPRFPVDGLGGAGVAVNKQHAMLKAFYECLERVALSLCPRYDSDVEGDRWPLDDWACRPVGELPRLRLSQGRNLITDAPVVVPAQLVYVPYPFDEPLLRDIVSTGAAAGPTKLDALKSGALEVIERDAFMRAYYARTPVRKIEDLRGPVTTLMESVRMCDLEAIILELSTDAKCHVVLCVVMDSRDEYVPVSLGAKAHPDPSVAILGAVEEALQVRAFYRVELQRNPSYSEPIETITERAAYWASRDRLGELNMWLDADCPRVRYDDLTRWNWDELVGSIRDLSWRFAYVDLTPADWTAVCVVKVLSPDLQFMHLNEHLKVFHPRLLSLRSAEQLDAVPPHPFL